MTDKLKAEINERWVALINRLYEADVDAPVFVWLISKLVIAERELYAKKVLEEHHPQEKR